MAASQLLAAAVAAAVFLAALPVPPARCQQQQVAIPPPASTSPPVRLPPSAPPPLVGVPPGVLMARIDAVRDELAAEVQAKYGFCMANVQEDFTQAFSFSNASFVSDCMEETQGQMTGMLCEKAEIEIYVKSLGKKPSTRGITVQQQPKNLTVLRGTIAVKAPQRNVVILSVVLLLVYNCSDQFIKIRAKILSKSRRKAATIAQESATARGRWKLAKELVLSHELEMSESDQLAASSNEARHATEGNGKRSKNRKKLAHARTERFRRAYSQIGRERVLQPDNDKITLSGVVALAAENRSRRPMFEVVFKGLTLSIGKKKLLQCVTGKLSPGRVTAIMGPSGAGKTTFLNAVLGKTTGYKKDGLVLINGKSGSMQSYKKIIGFVPQDDIVHGNLTVEENLWFSACCRSSKGMSKSDKIIVLERVIGSLGLQEIRNSLVGTVEKRGISGGQRKRVNVGIEMVMEPSLLILDEPTTGLDSASSQLLLRALRHEALQGVNVCAVIHQPSYTLFNMFDDFVLLARGGLIAYLGPISEVETYFSSLGIKVPERENPPDYYIDILEGITKTKMRGHAAPKHLPLLWMLRNGYEVPEYMQKDLEDINNVHELYTVGSMSREQSFGDQSENADSVHQNVREPYSLLDRKTPGVLAQYKYYLGRVTKQRLREATLQAVDYLILCIAGICIGTIAKVKDDTFGVASYGYTIIAVSLLCQLAALRSFSPERLQYWRERESGMSTLAYFLARDTIDHFNTLVKPVAFLSTFYFFNNPRSEFKDNYLVFLALVYCVTGIGYTFAIWFELGLAQLCSALIPVVLVLVGTQPNIPNFIKGLCYPKWALEALIIAGAKKYSGVWLITRCGALLKGGYDINNFVLCIVIVMLMGSTEE
uniref:ABC transporter domain-containing protein n=1 Tax=Oryza glumipatula TaxID=40148 RepID=A0A0E0BB17_9ORYZ